MSYVSIIIPVKDSKKDLEGLLKSLGEMDYPKDKIEILVVDNNSTDGTDRVALSFAGVKLLRETKPSSYAARNRGIRESRYGLLAFVDADCRVTPAWLHELIEAIHESPWIGAVGGANRPLDETHLISRLERKFGGNLNKKGNPFSPSYAITMNVLYRKQVFEQLGLFDEDQISGSDVDMCWRMQFFSFWKLKILADKAWVIHRDVTAWHRYVKRIVRIGHGNYGLYQKYPVYLAHYLSWLARTRVELVLQFLKTLYQWEKRTPKLQKSGIRMDSYFCELRLFLMKWGYLKAIRQEIRKKKRDGSFSSYFVFIGSKIFNAKSPEYGGFQKKVESGVRILHVDPPVRSYARVLFQILRSLLGFTNVWYWRWGMESLEFWDIPFLSFKLNALRVSKGLRMKKTDRCVISGDVSQEVLETWREALGKNRTTIEPFYLSKNKEDIEEQPQLQMVPGTF
ncbi:MAG: glycosyltransferase [Candidatus Omnitrophica bacterium]|nr:glycosyltransferase [Candidatus Omnitrophota bacterium]